MSVKSYAVTATGALGMQHYVRGWYFTETGGVSTITVVIRAIDGSGTILWKHTIKAGGSVGEDLADPIDLNAYSGTNDVHVTVTGSGTCQGAVRGR